MADETVESDQIQQRPHKRKHTQNLQSKNRKKWKLPHARGQVKREKSQSGFLGFPKTAAEMSSNWKILQATLQKERKKAEEKGEVKHRSRKTFKTRLEPSESSQKAKSEIWFDDVDPEDLKQATGSKTVETTTGNENLQKTLITGNMERLTKRIALDCEMVGIGTGGRKHMLARVSVVNSHGHAVYDSFVAPQEKVVDYRTSVSGVRPADLRNAPDFKTVQFNVSKLLKGRILVGHSLKNDLAVLFLGHPGRDIRDTAKYRPFQEKLKDAFVKKSCKALFKYKHSTRRTFFCARCTSCYETLHAAQNSMGKTRERRQIQAF
ncbi:RNA exonuclease 4-like isoform X2 [Montipora foliosa]|uniref:RNA exonuclease 4-like isoform X2 n=1 Tax=Montipora foliosa TaxID=591990 RepID=UPI0035F109DD